MKLYDRQFLGAENEFADWRTARYAVLPVPYEGAVSYGRGAAAAPNAILDASCFLEFYDEVLQTCPHQAGIVTVTPPPICDDHAEMHENIYLRTKEIVDAGKIPVILGGDHSISSGVFRALKEAHGDLSCIQLDAHADLRNEYEGSIYSHASVMARIREMTPHTLQLGIRSMSQEEAEVVARDDIKLCTMHDLRRGRFPLDDLLAALPDPVFITFDLDAFDWSVISGTGTPEPGGFLWDEAIDLLRQVFERKRVVGFDVVELAAYPHDRNSPFAAAKLIYKMIAFCTAYYGVRKS